MILDAVRESGGEARAAREGGLTGWMRRVSSLEGIALCPESATCVDVLAELVREGRVERDARVVIFNTGAAQKYAEVMEQATGGERVLERDEPVDWDALAAV
jgi:threonine synthase